MFALPLFCIFPLDFSFWNIICYYIFLFIDKNCPLYVCMFFRKGISNLFPQCIYVELWTLLGARSSIHKCHGWNVYSLQVSPILFSFLSLVLVQLCRGCPCFLWPCGFQSKPLWWYCLVVFFIMCGQSIVTLFLSVGLLLSTLYAPIRTHLLYLQANILNKYALHVGIYW